jgi:phage terminase large subunit
LRWGIWAAAEGTVFEDSWDRARNVVDRFEIPKEWPRYLAVDFGYTHPFCCLWAAVDPDGRIYIYRQIYRTKRLVEDHARDIAVASGWYHLLPKDHPRYSAHPSQYADPLPRVVIVDHDAEDYKTLERHLGLYTTKARKTVSDGIQALASRFRPSGDGKPRFMILRNSLVESDEELAKAKKPICLEDEPDVYVWDTRQGMKKGEQPVKENDHGIDPARYLAAHFDLTPSGVSYVKEFWS